MISSINNYDYENSNFSLNISFHNNVTSHNPFESFELSVGRVFLAIFLIGLEFLTISGNVLVLLSIFVDFHLRSPSHFLMGSLAIADLMLGLVVLPFSSVQLFFGRWLFSDVFCEIWISKSYKFFSKHFISFNLNVIDLN
jgi:hypothetical protein